MAALRLRSFFLVISIILLMVVGLLYTMTLIMKDNNLASEEGVMLVEDSVMDSTSEVQPPILDEATEINNSVSATESSTIRTEGIQEEEVSTTQKTYFRGDINYLGVLNVTPSLFGSIDWSKDFGASVKNPIVADNVVFVATSEKELFALERETGNQIWKQEYYVTTELHLYDGVLYFGSQQDIIALDIYTGEQLWIFPMKEFTFSTPVVSEGLIFFANLGGEVFALNKESGEQVWKYTLTSNEWIAASPLVTNELVYIGSNIGMHALNIYGEEAGSARWVTATEGPIAATAAFAEGKVFVGDQAGTFYAFDAFTGEVVWDTTIGSQLNSDPVIVDDSVYIASTDRSLYELARTTGDILWSAEIGAMNFNSPLAVVDYLYVATQDGFVYALNRQTKEIAWKLNIGHDSSKEAPTPYATNGVVYFGSTEGKLYAIE